MNNINMLIGFDCCLTRGYTIMPKSLVVQAVGKKRLTDQVMSQVQREFKDYASRRIDGSTRIGGLIFVDNFGGSNSDVLIIHSVCFGGPIGCPIFMLGDNSIDNICIVSKKLIEWEDNGGIDLNNSQYVSKSFMTGKSSWASFRITADLIGEENEKTQIELLVHIEGKKKSDKIDIELFPYDSSTDECDQDELIDSFSYVESGFIGNDGYIFSDSDEGLFIKISV